MTSDPSEAVRAAGTGDIVTFQRSDRYGVELAFDGEREARRVDLWPAAPVVACF